MGDVLTAPAHSRVYLRKTHPGMYHWLMTLSLLYVSLAVNFWYRTPTFNPIPVEVPIVAFFVLGVAQLVFLNWLRDLRLLRVTLALSVGWSLFWGLINSQQSFRGDASFQVPLLFIAFAVLYVLLLIEAPVNPMTEKKQ